MFRGVTDSALEERKGESRLGARKFGLVVAEAEEKYHLLEGAGDVQPSPLHSSTATLPSALEEQHPTQQLEKKSKIKMNMTSEETEEWYAFTSKNFCIASWTVFLFTCYMMIWLGI